MQRMRYFWVVAVLTWIMPHGLLAQNPVPNAGFENWTGLTLPGWTHNGGAPPIDVVVQSADAYSGLSAVRGEVKQVAGFPFPPSLRAGTLQDPLFPVSENHSSFSLYYKFQPQGGDTLFIQVVLLNTVTGGAGEGHAQIGTSQGSYAQVNIPIVYDPNNPPGFHASHASIVITIQPPAGQSPHIGTYFLVDHVTFDGYPLGVKELSGEGIPETFELAQNYPNPFNPSTNIRFQIPAESHVTLSVHNILGEEVATLVNGTLNAGNYVADWNATGVPSGVYFSTLRANGRVMTKKMMLMK